MGIVYKLTSPSGKIYIGQTIRDFNKRIMEHCSNSEKSIISNSINKYGFHNFKCEILFDGNNNELNDKEIYYIKFYNSLEPNGYNVRTGGSNGSHSELSRQRMREKKLGDLNPNYGKPRTERFIQIMKEKTSGINHHFYGKQLSYQHKLNLSKSHKNYDLPIYLIKVKERPEKYSSTGYAIINHPNLKNKYFTSKKISDEDKYKLAIEYLNSCKDEGSTTKQ
jgi:group I intron endonuclease